MEKPHTGLDDCLNATGMLKKKVPGKEPLHFFLSLSSNPRQHRRRHVSGPLRSFRMVCDSSNLCRVEVVVKQTWNEHGSAVNLHVLECYAHQKRCNIFESARTRKYFNRFWCAYHSLRMFSPPPTSLRNRPKITVQIHEKSAKRLDTLI